MSDNDPLIQALILMQKALQLLDEAKAAPHVGANLDLATCQLQDEIAARVTPPKRGTTHN